MVQPPETEYARSGDTHIAYQVVGEGPVDLLYIPGWTYSHVDLIWEWPPAADYLRRLASFSRLIIFDKRGIGASDRQAQVPTIENHLDDVNAVRTPSRAQTWNCWTSSMATRASASSSPMAIRSSPSDLLAPSGGMHERRATPTVHLSLGGVES